MLCFEASEPVQTCWKLIIFFFFPSFIKTPDWLSGFQGRHLGGDSALSEREESLVWEAQTVINYLNEQLTLSSSQAPLQRFWCPHLYRILPRQYTTLPWSPRTPWQKHQEHFKTLPHAPWGQVCLRVSQNFSSAGHNSFVAQQMIFLTPSIDFSQIYFSQIEWNGKDRIEYR